MADAQSKGRTTQGTQDPTKKQQRKRTTNMAFVKVEGRVDRLLGSKGFVLQERITTSTGQTWEKPWTIWGTQPTENALVEVTGELRTEVAKHYETKEILLSQAGQPYVATSIGDAIVKVLREGKPAEAAQWEAPEQGAPF
jgi:hypothetical protein